MNQAHRVVPESRARWLIGMAGEIGVLLFVLVVVLALTGLNS